MKLGKKWPALVAATLFLSACGGGGGGGDEGDGDPTPTETKTGRFVDAAVAGIGFLSLPSGTTGTTNAAGEFRYVDGDTVKFTVGAIIVGSAAGQALVTPRVIADATVGLPAGVTSTDVAKNIAIFLQSFDADGNPDNGITIAANVAGAAASLTLNFGQPTNEFVEDDSLNQLADDTGNDVVTPEAASAHLDRQGIKEIAGTWLRRDPASPGGIATVTFFTDGTYVFGSTLLDSDECDQPDSIEWGRFSLDAASGSFRTSDLYVDTAGFGCPGLFVSEEEQEETDTQLTLDNEDRLIYSFDGGGEPCTSQEETLAGGRCGSVLTRVAAGTGIPGSWLLDTPVAAGEPVEQPIVVTFLPDNKYFMVHVESGGDEGGEERGLEFGNWSVGAGGALTVTPSIDTNGDAGLSDTHPAKLKVEAGGKLALEVESEGTYRFSRLPLTETIQAGDLLGSWYAVDPADANADPEAAPIILATFFSDGTYVLGGQGGDENCDADYGNPNPDPTGPLDPDGVGSEYGRWHLETGSGRVYADHLLVDSDGSCGLHSANDLDPSRTGSVYFRKIDVDTLEVTSYEFQDGGTGEDDSGSYQLSKILIKRVKSVANSVVGSWLFEGEDGSPEVWAFFPNGSDFYIDTDDNGGVQRFQWSLNSAGTELTTTPAGDFCDDTVNGESSCGSTEEGAVETYALTYTNAGKQLTLKKAAEESFTIRKISSP